MAATPPDRDDARDPGVIVEAGRETTARKNILVEVFEKIPWNAFSVVGLLVFLLSGLSILYVIIAFVPTESVDNFEVLRSVELLLRLGATAVVVATIASFRNAFIVVFGIFLIAALIVPRGDLIRLALLASGSPNKFRDFFVETTPMKNPDARDREVASQIMDSLIMHVRQPLRNDIFAIDVTQPVTSEDAESYEVIEDYLTGNRRRFTETIANIVRSERERAVFAQLAQRGSLPLLEAIADEQTNQFIYKYGDDEKLRDDFSFLRSEGVIRFPYDDFEIATTTPFGIRVLAWNTDDRTVDSVTNEWETVPFFPPIQGRGLRDWPSNIADLPTVDLSQSGESVHKQVVMNNEGNYFRLNIKEAGSLLILTSNSAEGVDPLITLFLPDREIIASNDDTIGIESQIEQFLSEPGEYVFYYQSIAREGSSMLTFQLTSGPQVSNPDSRSGREGPE